MSARRPFTITNLHRDSDYGFWRARVTCNGASIDVDKRDGSWLADVRDRPGAHSFHREFVLPHVAAAIQAQVRTREAREARARKRAVEGRGEVAVGA